MPSELPSSSIPTDSPTPAVPASESERVVSDAFWNPISEAQPPVMRDWMFDSVEQLAGFADLVVLGRVTDVFIGEEWVFVEGEPGQPFLYARIAIDEVLKGHPVTRQPGYVEFQLTILGLDDGPPGPGTVPEGQALFFLSHEATYRETRGLSPRTTEIAPYAYFDAAPEAVMRDLDGSVRLIEPGQMAEVYGEDYYPLLLEGTSFDQLLLRIRDLNDSPQ
jgi:hypothetical protein